MRYIILLLFGLTTSYAAIKFDNIAIDGNTISSENTNGDITLDPNGNGDVIFTDLTASTVPYLDASKSLLSSAVTPTELGYLSGVTSAIQTQITDHLADTTTHGTTGNIVGTSDTQTLSNKTLTSPVINTGVSGTAILDDDTMATASATTLATSESIKAYVDAGDAGGTNLGFYSGNIAGGNASLSTSSVSTYTEFGNSSLSLSLGTDSNSMGIACDAPATETQEVGDTTCTGSEGNELFGVVITPASTTRYLRMCFVFSNNVQDGSAAANLGFQGTFQLTTTENNATTILANGQDRAQFSLLTNSGGGAEVVSVGQAFYVCGLFKFADTNVKRITLRYEQVVSGTLASHTVYADSASSAGQRDVSVFGYYLQ